jgi:nucleoside-diphosphate-sugar epimerase
MQQDRILVIGALGQLGSELADALREAFGEDNVIISDIRRPLDLDIQQPNARFEELNVLDSKRLGALVDQYKITQIYHLAAGLSATGEQDPLFAWQINTDGTLNVLEVAREKNIRKVYFPSSIAVFGADTPRQNTPQNTIMNPSTVYGISKQTCERWCEYYFNKFGLDVRSLRYPGIISHKAPPGGGTTDYAVEIFYKAVASKSYKCFLQEDTYLPMIYMPDAIKATLQLMDAPAQNISVRSSYNLGAISFSPLELTQEIQKYIPEFSVKYVPDFRQNIANSWPQSIDDTVAKKDWAWKPDFDLALMTEDMLVNLQRKAEKIAL